MSGGRDWFRPTHEIPRALYDAFQKEAAHREERGFREWHNAEVMAVWREARDQAEAHGLPRPPLELIKEAEQSAAGHVDYGSKWAYSVWHWMMENKTDD